ncbi:hypothetical protein BD310DRAFT_706237 [Dichomitus squalens]|uniref:Uncharacterized protein n=1 Tax=Dichomitus squalens TaxID=114155 RepID=A0A4V2K796_9APHY|nr:hypothetical protein BD310DRAFT_706237 [Dichomitus squalens]
MDICCLTLSYTVVSFNRACPSRSPCHTIFLQTWTRCSSTRASCLSICSPFRLSLSQRSFRLASFPFTLCRAVATAVPPAGPEYIPRNSAGNLSPSVTCPLCRTSRIARGCLLHREVVDGSLRVMYQCGATF